MSVGQYQLWLATDKGVRLANIDNYLGFEYTIVRHSVGVMKLILPHTFDITQVHEDYKLELWRQAPGGTNQLENIYMVRNWRDATDGQGTRTITLTGVDGNDLLKRRDVSEQPSKSSGAYVRMTGAADNIAKQIVRYEVGPTSSTAGWLLNENYFAVAADQSLGASFTKKFPWRNVLDIVTAVCDTSTGRGTPIYWRVVPVSTAKYEFRTFLNQIGADRRSSVILGTDQGNVAEMEYEWNSIDEVNYVMLLGAIISGEDRWEADMYDSQRRLVSVYAGYRSGILSLNFSSTAGASDAREDGRDYLVEHRPIETFKCTLAESEGFRYGLNWNFGDRLTAAYQGRSYTVNVIGVKLTVGASEKVEATLQIPGTYTQVAA